MLYNPKWKTQQTRKTGKALKVPSLENMDVWLEKQDPAQGYNYDNSMSCACAQYARDHNAFDAWRYAYSDKRRAGWRKLDDLARGPFVYPNVHTFGEMRERVRKAMLHEAEQW